MPKHIVVAVCTCRRPGGLRRLLHALAAVEVEDALSVVVVDNDAGRKGYMAALDLAPEYRWPLHVLLEARAGISHARNRAVAHALGLQADAIAMLDDDEWPEPEWLRELLRVQRDTGAAVVGGPVLPHFESRPLAWSHGSHHYGLVRPLRDAAPCVLYGAGNFLAVRACFEAVMPEPFDPAFALSGGEDLVFFHRLAQLGFSMRWAANAIAHEAVPRERMSLRWLAQRQRRRGCLNVAVQRLFAPGLANEAVRAAKTAGVLAHAGLVALAELVDRRTPGRASLLLNYALGRIAGHRGRLFEEYRPLPASAPATAG